MQILLLGIFIGAALIYYFTNRYFRHIVHNILLFFLRIPVKFFEFIDDKTCYPIKRKSVKIQRTATQLQKPKTAEMPDFDRMNEDDLAKWIERNSDKIEASAIKK
jgi:hypothetical protein